MQKFLNIFKDSYSSSLRYIKLWSSSFHQISINVNKKKEPLLKLPSPVDIDEEEMPKQSQQHPSDDYMFLKTRFRDIGRMNGISEALGRDFLTAMPTGAYKSRLG